MNSALIFLGVMCRLLVISATQEKKGFRRRQTHYTDPESRSNPLRKPWHVTQISLVKTRKMLPQLWLMCVCECEEVWFGSDAIEISVSPTACLSSTLLVDPQRVICFQGPRPLATDFSFTVGVRWGLRAMAIFQIARQEPAVCRSQSH